MAWHNSNFVFSQKFTHRQSRVGRCIALGQDTNLLRSTVQAGFAEHVPVDAVTHQHNNLGLQFVLMEQIHDAQLHELQKKQLASSSQLSGPAPF